MVYAALSKGWRRPGKKLVNARSECAIAAATYSVGLNVSSQDVERPSDGPEFMLNLPQLGQTRQRDRVVQRARFVPEWNFR
jgi:hypothetical protein